MKASFEKVEKNVALLEVEVPAEQVDVALDQAFKKVVTKVNVPGFRKGKVPRAIFDRKFGVQSLYNDAIEILLPEAYAKAVEETGINPVDQPDVDIVAFDKGQSFVFKAKVIVKPEVELGNYKGLDVSFAPATVTEEELAEELTRLQNRHAELVVLEEGTVEAGDIAIIDFEGFIDGVAFEGGKGEQHSLEIGSNSFIPGFEDQVIGMAKEDSRDIEVTFPENYHSDEFAGKAAVFKVKLHEIKRKVLPALDDEFALDVSEFETLEAFKNDLQEKLLKSKQEQVEREFETNVVEQASANASVEIPEVMVENEINFMFKDFERRLSSQGMNLDLYYQFTGQNEQAVREQMTENAEKAVRNRLVLEAIAKAEAIEVSEEDFTAELEKLAEQYKRSVEEIRAIFEQNGSISNFQQDILTGKTIKFLVENNHAESAKPKKTTRKKSATDTKTKE
jgi:trigger factor